MAFPNAIANEPPPCMSSEDEDSEEFHSHGLKLDVPSGEPTPVSTPRKKSKQTSKSIENTSEEGSLTFVDNNLRPTSVTVNSDTDNEREDLILEVISTAEETSNHLQSVDLPKENGTASPELSVINEFSINGTETELPVKADKVVSQTNHELAEKSISIRENHASLRQDSEDTDGSSVATTSASEPETANEICDNTANNEVSETNQTSGHCEHVDPSSRSEESEETNCENIGSIINEVQQIEQNELCDNYDKVQTLSPSSPPTDVLEDKTEVPPEVQEDLNTSITADPEFVEFQAGSSSSVRVHESTGSGSPSSDEPVTTAAALAEQTDDLDEYDDFGAFQSIPDTIEQEHATDLGTSSVGFDDEEDDDFGDFAQVPVQQITAEVSVQAPKEASAQRTLDDSDFADFQDCSFQSFGAPMLARRHSSTSSDIALISSKVDSIVKSLFVADSLPDTDVKLKSIDSEISISNDQVWTSVQDFEGSQGLAFKWGNSLTEKRLLRSLNIDNSNIMYHEKWGTIEVPKFAASLVMSPLQPQSCNPNLADSDVKADTRSFTVNNNNLKEGISCQDQDKPPSISAEAQEILRQLPDLSYMRANTLVFPQTSPSGI